MDPICHTLVGAALAETRLGRLTRVATPTLVVAANLPDVDVFAYVAGGDAALGFRRGWTHGVLAMIVLPILLAGLVAAIDRWWCRRAPGRTPARLGPILALSYVGVLSHPLLDWLNVYGVRLLMPFDDRWFYGDVLFIVDAWLWLALGLAVAVARRGRRPSGWSWLVLGALVATLVVRATPSAATTAGWVWVAALAGGGFVVSRAGVASGGSRHRLVELVLVACLLYVGVMFVGRLHAERAADALGGDGRAMAAPLPVTPAARDVVVLRGDEYVVGRFAWGDEQITETHRVPTGPDDELVRRAWASPTVSGFRHWARFPWAEVEPLDDETVRVWLGDARYARSRTRGFGGAVVDLPVEPLSGPGGPN